MELMHFTYLNALPAWREGVPSNLSGAVCKGRLPRTDHLVGVNIHLLFCIIEFFGRSPALPHSHI